jgi:hypothetical protein
MRPFIFLAVVVKENYLPRVIETWLDVMGRLSGLSARGETVMGVLVAFLHRWLSPFVAGACVAGITVVNDISAIVALILAAGISCYVSLPAGGRKIKRLFGVAS